MSDAIHVEQGADPWRPSASSELTAVLHRFSIPLVGIINQEGVSFLFWCVTGHAGPENSWGYARVSDEDVERLRNADGPDAFNALLRDVVRDRVSTFAIASEKGVLESVVINPPASFDDAHPRGMQELGQKLSEVIAQYQELQERFPQLQEAAHFNLVPTPSR